MGMELIIGGDIVPSFKNVEYFENSDEHYIVDKNCEEVLVNADFRIFNLETPITDTIDPIDKDGANFAISSKSINGLKKLNPNVITVANNHCKDQGVAGLQDTIELLSKENITPIGYGMSHKKSNDVTTLKKDGIVVSIIACAETEFNLFENGEIGAVPYHDYWTNKKIAEAKKNSDLVIVLYHGGTEYFQYVPPYLRDRCHLMVENGADYILCQHSHCIGCEEKYEGSTIVYGQGNFIFHQRNNKPITKEGLLVRLSIDKDNSIIEYIPVVLNEDDQVCVAREGKKDKILEGFENRSQVIKDHNGIDREYTKYALDKYDMYYSRLYGSNRLLRLVMRIMNKLNKDLHNKDDYIHMVNVFQNETHRELFMKALKEKILEEEDADE